MPDSSISLETRILDLPDQGFGLGLLAARKLAAGIAGISSGKDVSQVNVDDLLHYLPMRYEDRSKLTCIKDLSDGMEASLELFVKLSGGKQVGGWRRSFRQRLYIFKISAIDRERTGKDVLVWTFLSGLSAPKIIDSYEKKFTRGVRFIAFGKWEWDASQQTYSLRLNKPDEIEILPPLGEALATETPQDESHHEAPAAIHVGRRVPVYRKINDIRPKQLREIIHTLLAEIPPATIGDTLPADLRKRQRLIDRAAALNEIHFPADESSLIDYENARSAAHQRLIFEEFFWLALGLSVKRGGRLKENKGATFKIDDPIKRTHRVRFAFQTHRSSTSGCQRHLSRPES
jgi:ATP-dependent DNA helicase RecG